MKRLITAAAISLAVGFSNTSFADTQVFGVKTPVGENTVETGHQVKGSYVETDHTSFYTGPKEMNDVKYSLKDSGTNREYVVVFGVKVPVGSRI
jgi:hypothetical protein